MSMPTTGPGSGVLFPGGNVLERLHTIPIGSSMTLYMRSGNVFSGRLVQCDVVRAMVVIDGSTVGADIRHVDALAVEAFKFINKKE